MSVTLNSITTMINDSYMDGASTVEADEQALLHASWMTRAIVTDSNSKGFVYGVNGIQSSMPCPICDSAPVCEVHYVRRSCNFVSAHCDKCGFKI